MRSSSGPLRRPGSATGANGAGARGRRRLGFGLATAIAVAALGGSRAAQAQQAVEGFAVERFYASAPGGGWLVMDDLTMHGSLGGAISISSGYAHDPLRVATADGSQRLSVVSDEAFADLGLAATYDRFRVYVDFTSPLVIAGQAQKSVVGAYQFTSPSVDVGKTPDILSDVRLGVDARILGTARSSFRLGAGAQLYLPGGDRSDPDHGRADYDTDGTFRAMIRALFAGEVGPITYAGQLGVHIRPLDDAPAPGSPQGSELLFGAAAGPRWSLDRGRLTATVGPEVYGETAFRSFLKSTATGVEGLVTGRIEQSDGDGPRLRFKIGAGGGLDARFGAPEWRVVAAFEVVQFGASSRPK